MNSDSANIWLEENWSWLVKEYNNQWIGATATGEIGKGRTFDIALESFQERNISLSEVVFVFLTEDAIQ